MKCYVSNRPDPQALTVNTFSIAWKDLQFYASRLSASSHKRLVKFSGGKRQRWWQTPSTAFRHLPPNSEYRFPAPSSKKDVVNQYLEFGVSGGGATLANTGLVAAALLTSRLLRRDPVLLTVPRLLSPPAQPDTEKTPPPPSPPPSRMRSVRQRYLQAGFSLNTKLLTQQAADLLS